jgi:sarcosine oxidase subunit alpha
MNGRIDDHPVLGPLTGKRTISFWFQGKRLEALEGETIAAALLANGIRTLRVHEETGTPRGIYCNIGHCFECRVTVNGVPGLRGCMTQVEDDMDVVPGGVLPAPLKKGGHGQ